MVNSNDYHLYYYFAAAIIHTLDQVELWRSYPENTVTPFSQKSVGIFRRRFSLAP
jgi:hypothetical protein